MTNPVCRFGSVPVGSWLVLAGALVPALSLGAAGAAGDLPPDFTGAWTRDAEASDDVAEQIEELRAGTAGGAATSPPPSAGSGAPWGGVRRPGQGGAGAPSGGFRRPGSPLPGQGGAGGPGCSGQGGPGPGPGQGGTAQGGPSGQGAGEGRGGGRFAALERLTAGIESLRIEQSERQLLIENAQREVRVVLLDGQAMGDGLGGESRAHFQDGALQVETRNDRATRIETFTLDELGRLVVATEIETKQRSSQPLLFRTVYTRDAETAAAYPATADPAAPGVEAEADAPEREDAGGPEVAQARLVRRPAAAPAAGAEAETAERPGGETEPTRVRSDLELEPMSRRAVIRLLPPEPGRGGLLAGRVVLETLTMDAEIAAVEFLLDDIRVERRATLPFEAKVTLADPPREQVATAVAFDAAGRRLGEDRLVLNLVDPPFRVRIASLAEDPAAGGLRIEAAVSVPRKASLERVTFYRGDQAFAERTVAPFAADLPASDSGAGALRPDEFVRVVARLADGRELEDVELLRPGRFAEEVEVELVQIQVLVTDGSGVPVTDLAAADFQIVDAGKPREIERVYQARDVALVLGLAIDSSGSMVRSWDTTRLAAERFLDDILTSRDRAFLVDFDSRLRLLQPLTSDKSQLSWALDRLQPQGGTALYDSILFSLLQFTDEPGRRALIVITDGFDSESKSNPTRAVAFGRRLGVPVYGISIEGRGEALPPLPSGPGRPPAPSMTAYAAERDQLKLITNPTGGRLLRVVSEDQIARAFAQIEDELRKQYIVTFYTDRPEGVALAPEVKVLRKGLRARAVIPLDLAR